MKKPTLKKDYSFNGDMYLWDGDQKIEHIRELHQHIQDSYDEIDRLTMENDCLKDDKECCNNTYDELQDKIKKLVEANLDLGGQVLKLKAELYDLLR